MKKIILSILFLFAFIPFSRATTTFPWESRIETCSSATDGTDKSLCLDSSSFVLSKCQTSGGTCNQVVNIGGNSATSTTAPTTALLATGSVAGATSQEQTFTDGINGSTAANGVLTIEGTSNATRTTSYLNLQPNGGNVGIGTTGPGQKLEVNGNVLSNGYSSSAGQALMGNVSGYPGIWFGANATTPSVSNYAFLYDSGGPTTIFNTPSGGKISFRIANGTYFDMSGANGYTFMNGNVGIGTTSPSQMLTVGNNNQFTVSSAGAVVVNGGISSPQGTYSERFGLGASATGTSALAVGYVATANYAYGTAIGQGAIAGVGNGNTAVGEGAYATSTVGANTAVGFEAQATGGLSAAFGGNASGAESLAMGYGSGAAGSYGFAMGYGANEQSLVGIALGAQSSVPSAYAGSIAIGYSAAATAASQMVIGGPYGINDVYIGNGVTYATPAAVAINPSGASGTDVAGANLVLAAGKATGAGVGGDLLFKTSDVLGSGATLQSLTSKMVIKNNGNVGIGTTSPEGRVQINGADALYSTAAFTIENSASARIMQVTNDGRVYLGSGSFGGSNAVLSVNNTAAPQSGKLLGQFTDSSGTLTLYSNQFVGSATTFGFGPNNAGASFYQNNTINYAVNTYGDGTNGANVKMGIGIGAASAPTATLDIRGYGTNTPFSVASSSGSSLMVINTSGNVGIGTTTPGANLEIARTNLSSAPGLQITSPSVTYGSAFLVTKDTSLGGGTAFSVDGVGNTTIGGNLAYYGDNFTFRGSTGNTIAWTYGDLNIGIASPATTLMTIKSGGNVGIGTASPNYLLEINGSLGVEGHIQTHGTAPTLTSCGGSPSIVGNDNSFTITVGTASTGCTATFATAWTNAPSCTVTNQSTSITNAMTYTVSTSAVVVSQAAGLSGDILNVVCQGHY